MKKLLALLLVSPLIYSEPSEDTKKYLWVEEVSMLTFGTHICNQTLNDEKNKSVGYILTANISCDYRYADDQIILSAVIQDLRGLYDSWTEEGFITEVYKTGEMSLDKVNEGCQKVMRDFESFEYAMHKIEEFNPFRRMFVNTGISKATFDYEEVMKHINSLFKVVIRLETTGIQDGAKGYTCEVSAKDKRYEYNEEYNFAITKEDKQAYYKRVVF